MNAPAATYDVVDAADLALCGEPARQTPGALALDLRDVDTFAARLVAAMTPQEIADAYGAVWEEFRARTYGPAAPPRVAVRVTLAVSVDAPELPGATLEPGATYLAVVLRAAWAAHAAFVHELFAVRMGGRDATLGSVPVSVTGDDKVRAELVIAAGARRHAELQYQLLKRDRENGIIR